MQRSEDDVNQPLSMCEENERRRLHILAGVDEAKASIAQGRGKLVTSKDQIAELVEATKRRGIARLIAEQNSRR